MKRNSMADAIDLGIQAIERLLPGTPHIPANVALANVALFELRRAKEALEAADPVAAAAQEILDDIEAARCEAPSAEWNYNQSEYWFGTFHESTMDGEIEWPNLSISAEKLKEALKTV